MHPLVRDLWKRVILVGRDYPSGLAHVKAVWKAAMRNPENCPAWYNNDIADANEVKYQCNNINITNNNNNLGMNKEDELMHAVHKGRLAVKEMIGVIQLKKYRSIKQRYSSMDDTYAATMARLDQQGLEQANVK